MLFVYLKANSFSFFFFLGNTWFTDEVLLAQARHMWKSMSYETRAEYGEDYFEQSIRSLQTYTKGEVC
jgi:hypothetical protein